MGFLSFVSAEFNNREQIQKYTSLAEDAQGWKTCNYGFKFNPHISYIYFKIPLLRTIE